MINYTEWSSQRIFNKVAKHLVTQNKKAILDGKSAFSDNDCNRCAYGCLAPLRDHNDDDFVMNYNTFYFMGIVGDKYWLMQELENCHNIVKPSRWRSRLRAIAKSHKLEIPEFLRVS